MRSPLGPWSLRSKISAALIVAAVLSIASTGGFSAWLSYSSLRRQAEEQALVLASALAEPVDEMVGRTRYSIDRLSRNPAIVSMDPGRQRYALDMIAGTVELLDGIVISDTKGRVLITDKTGLETEALLPSRPEPVLLAPAASGKIAISDVFRSSTGTICFAIGAPILRRGAVVGVLSGIIALERHSLGGMHGIRFGQSGYVYLIDSSGRTLSHPNPERFLENITDYRPPPSLKDAPGIFYWVNTEGEERLAALAPIADFGWYVAVSRLRREAEAPARRLMTVLLVILSAGVAGALALGEVLARLITAPVSRLSRAVRELSAGHSAVRIEPEGGDEIGQLTAAFNDMSASLTRTIRHLEAFGYSVAHDLRAPARTIAIFSELILKKEGGFDEESRRHVRRIMDAGRRLRLMLDGLLDLSRLSPASIVLEAVDLTALARECASELSALEPDRRIKIEIAEGMTARGDPRLLRTLLWNLMDNAWKFTRGRRDARVEIGRHGAHGGTPVYFVRDNGSGFDPVLAKRMFKPFHRLPNAEGVPGIGIGLAAAARVVESHGGAIWAESRPGEGAAFYFTLRVRDEPRDIAGRR